MENQSRISKLLSLGLDISGRGRVTPAPETWFSLVVGVGTGRLVTTMVVMARKESVSY